MMKRMKYTMAVAVAAWLAAFAQAMEIKTGLLGRYGVSEYKGVDAGFKSGVVYDGPVPFLEVDSTYLYAVLPREIGVHAFQNDFAGVDLTLGVIGGFDPDDSDDWDIQQLDERDMTLSAGIRGNIKTPFGIFGAAFRGDVLGESDALLARLSYRYPIQVTDELRIIPSVHLAWANDKQNTHRYGVSAEESGRSGLPAYEADHAITPILDLALGYRLTENISLLLNVGYEFLPDEVKDSPLVDEDGVWEVGLGIVYTFGWSRENGFTFKK